MPDLRDGVSGDLILPSDGVLDGEFTQISQKKGQYSLALSVNELIRLTKIMNRSITPILIWLLLFLFLAISVMAGLVMLKIMNWENYNPDFGGLVGGSLTGIAALIVVLFSLDIDNRRDIRKAKRSAKILVQILQSIGNQFLEIQKGKPEIILYPSSWLTFYYDITTMAKYDYLGTLLKEFNYAEQVNVGLSDNDILGVKKIIMERNQYNKYHFGWNIYDVIINLSRIQTQKGSTTAFQ